SMHRVHVTIDAAGDRVETKYDASGGVSNSTQEDMNLEGWVPNRIYNASAIHDEQGQTTETTDASGAATNKTYNLLSKVTMTRSALGHRVRHMYDGQSRLLMDLYDFYNFTAYNNFTRTALYNTTAAFTTPSVVAGNSTATFAAATTWCFCNTTAQISNSSIAHPLANSTTVKFHGALNVTFHDEWPDAANYTIIRGEQWIENKTLRWVSLNVTYDYDADGRLTEMRDGLNQTTKYKYDALGRKVRETFADGTYLHFAYDANDRVTLLVDSNGNAAYSSYDSLNRLKRINATKGAGVVGSDEQSFVYDAVGNKVIQWDNDTSDLQWGYSKVQRTYDSLGHVLSESESNGKAGLLTPVWEKLGFGKTVHSVYDGLGNRLRLTYPNGRVILYRYDALERLSHTIEHNYDPPLNETFNKSPFADPPASDTGVPKRLHDEFKDRWLANFTYIGPSLRNSRLVSNGINETRSYDQGGRLTGLQHRNATGELVVGFNYTFDIEGRKASEQKLHSLDQSEAYGMDVIGRLTNFTRKDLSTGVLSPIGLQERNWTLDYANNWAKFTSKDGSGTVTETRNHTISNELVKETVGAATTNLVYDGNGNLRDDGVHTFKWDFKNRLREVHDKATGNLVAKYWYDAENRRIRKEVAQEDTIVNYFLDGMNEIQESGACTGVAVRQWV
ncbi:MAG: hypothetical protein LC620_03560, partial [Halobacteriales archaeon]|nr:hypothetical protein [Halobacteriales archaeon]